MVDKKYVADVLRRLREELKSQGMTVEYKGLYQGNLLFFTDHPPVNGRRGVFGYPQYVLVDPKDPYMRAYVSDDDLKITNEILSREERKKKKAAKA